MGLWLIFRFVLGAVFLSAGLAKARDIRSFSAAVREYQLLPSNLLLPAAILVPGAELAGGVALVLGIFLRPALVALGLLLAMFTFAVAINLARGRHIGCGCGGLANSREISWGLMYRNAALSAVTILSGFEISAQFALHPGVAADAHGLTGSDALASLILAVLVLLAFRLVSESCALLRAVRRLTAAQGTSS
jgi:uncharacterized membrane protein YphA (DoxX/SURF4 family)